MEMKPYHDGDCAGMRPAAGLRGRDALNAVHAALPAQGVVRAGALELDGRVLDAVPLGVVLRDDGRVPPDGVGEALVHAQDVGEEEARLGAADAGLELHERGEVLGGGGRDEQRGEGAGDHDGEGGSEGGDLFVCEGGHGGVGVVEKEEGVVEFLRGERLVESLVG